MNLLITRPEPDALALKAAVEARGHEAIVDPLMRVELTPDGLDSLDGIVGLIATSRNALHALRRSPLVEAALHLPLFAVGRATAAEARRMGFAQIAVGPGSASGVPPMVASALDPADGLILHLAGEVVAGNVSGELEELGFRVVTATVYRMVAAATLKPSTIAAIQEGEVEGVVLMSPRTARIYARLVARHALERSVRHVVHLCVSEGVATALKSILGPVPVEVADAPGTADMLALIDTVAAGLDN